MISTIAILNTSRLSLSQSLTLVGYIIVLTKIAGARQFESESQSFSQQLADP